MKIYLTAFSLFLGMIGFSQSFPESTSLPPATNEFGDPLNNRIDANGSKQGFWYYINTFGQITARQYFEDNELRSTEIRISESEYWIPVNSDIANLEQWTNIKNVILETLGSNSLGASQLIAVFKTNEGTWAIQLFGAWDNPSGTSNAIRQLLENQTMQNNFYAIIQ